LIAAAKKKETERLKVARDEFDKVKEKFCKLVEHSPILVACLEG